MEKVLYGQITWMICLQMKGYSNYIVCMWNMKLDDLQLSDIIQ